MQPRGSVACGRSLPTFVQLKKIVADSMDFVDFVDFFVDFDDFDDFADYFLVPD